MKVTQDSEHVPYWAGRVTPDGMTYGQCDSRLPAIYGAPYWPASRAPRADGICGEWQPVRAHGHDGLYVTCRRCQVSWPVSLLRLRRQDRPPAEVRRCVLGYYATERTAA